MTRFLSCSLAISSFAFAPVALAQEADEAAETAEAAPTSKTYSVSSSDTMIYVLVKKAGLASAVAHDHAIQAKSVSGSMVWNSADPSATTVNISVDASSLAADSDSMRKLAGLPDSLDADQQAEIKDKLLASDQLAASKYPKITFKSNKVSGTASALSVSGDFSLHGVTKPLTVTMAVTEDGGKIRAKGGFSVTQSNFGYEPFSAMFGALAVEDKAEVVLDIVLK